MNLNIQFISHCHKDRCCSFDSMQTQNTCKPLLTINCASPDSRGPAFLVDFDSYMCFHAQLSKFSISALLAVLLFLVDFMLHGTQRMPLHYCHALHSPTAKSLEALLSVMQGCYAVEL